MGNSGGSLIDANAQVYAYSGLIMNKSAFIFAIA